MRRLLLLLLLLSCLALHAQTRENTLCVVELNTENMFDWQHDTLKEDYDFLPDSPRHWTRSKYWKKINRIAQELTACGETPQGWLMPDIIALCEVENDSVLRDLTQRSLLRTARYNYVMTHSPDQRGIDVALLYSTFSFRLIDSHSIRIEPLKDMHPTRDILYAKGEIISGDTIHIFVVHAPSRLGGSTFSERFRLHVVKYINAAVDSIRTENPNANIFCMGDFNDYETDRAMQALLANKLLATCKDAKGTHGAKGTYRYHGQWGSLDHILLGGNIATHRHQCYIFDAPFLLEDETKYGGVRPRRFYNGMRFNDGFSDHLPLVLIVDL